MAVFVADQSLNLNDLITNGSLAELFSSASIIENTGTTFHVQDASTGEDLILTGSFSYTDGNDYPTGGLVTGATYEIGGAGVFSLTEASISVADFTAYVSADDIAGLFEQVLSGNDEVMGSSGNDYLFGFAGEDILRGGTGADHLVGGEGDDLLSEYAGDFGPFSDDIYDGGSGNDRVSLFTTYGPGVTVDLRLQTSQDTGSMGVDTFIGIEHITANYGDDTLIGNEAGNWFWTFSGTDTLSGNGGDDLFTVGLGTKVIDGGAGADTVQVQDFAFEPAYTADGVTISLLLQGQAQETGVGAFTLTSIENLSGFYGSDEFTGDGNANILAGEGGDDRLIGNGGNDTLAGDGTFGLSGETSGTIIFLAQAEEAAGNDYLNGGAGTDTMYGGLGNDTYVVDAYGDKTIENAGEGSDSVLSSASYKLSANVENLTLTGAADLYGYGNELGNTLTGNGGANKLYGLAGNDTLKGGAGVDTMFGGLGNDIYYVDSYTDKAIENAGEGTDSVLASASFKLGGNVEKLTLTGTADLYGYGNELANTLTGNSGANKLYGLAGNDTLNGGAGGDWLEGGVGLDKLFGGAGGDSFVFRDGDFAGATAATADQIKDFAEGTGDKIRLNLVDANTGLAGDQAFAFIGTGDFSGTAGELRYEQISGNTYVTGDTNGDGIADFMIRVDGLHTLVGTDFGL